MSCNKGRLKIDVIQFIGQLNEIKAPKLKRMSYNRSSLKIDCHVIYGPE